MCSLILPLVPLLNEKKILYKKRFKRTLSVFPLTHYHMPTVNEKNKKTMSLMLTNYLNGIHYNKNNKMI